MKGEYRSNKYTTFSQSKGEERSRVVTRTKWNKGEFLKWNLLEYFHSDGKN